MNMFFKKELKLLPGQTQIPSKECTEEDIKNVVIPLMPEIAKLCNTQHGKYPGAFAIAHCQVNQKNPLKFFVMNDGSAIVNLEIVLPKSALCYYIHHKEGCLSFLNKPETHVLRAKKITASFIGIDKQGKKRIFVNEIIRGKIGFMFQHEFDHFNCKTIYD